MSSGYTQLKGEPEPFETCPACGFTPFRAFCRGQFQRWVFRFLQWPHFTVICSECKEIVGHETP